VPESLVRRYGLKRGHEMHVQMRARGRGALSVGREIDKVMGINPEEISKITPFEELVRIIR